MGLFRSLEGVVQVNITSADPEGLLTALQQTGTLLREVSRPDALQLSFQVSRQDLRRIQTLAEKRGEQLKITGKRGLYWAIRQLWKRPVLVLGLTALLALSLWAPGRIFFLRVEGNSTIADARILEQAAACGIGFGASRRQIRSEHMKNELLNAMPELGWAGVNTYGCVAVITVRERSDPEPPEAESRVSSIVALRDGIIRDITVLQGSAKCRPGDAVKAGQLLVSGYTDCGIYIQATQAQAEIFAATRRRITVVSPTIYASRGEISDVCKKYSIIIGKKRINFTKDSGISGTTCAKIRTEYYLTLPGGFRLPVLLEVEQVISYKADTDTVWDATERLQAFAAACLKQQMIAGTIENSAEVLTDIQGLCRLDGVYDCTEMIGIQRIEENLLNYDKND